MPAGHAIKSEAQRRFLHAAAGRGEIPEATVHKMEHETKPSVKSHLPYHKKHVKHATVLDLLKSAEPKQSLLSKHNVLKQPAEQMPAPEFGSGSRSAGGTSYGLGMGPVRQSQTLAPDSSKTHPSKGTARLPVPLPPPPNFSKAAPQSSRQGHGEIKHATALDLLKAATRLPPDRRPRERHATGTERAQPEMETVTIPGPRDFSGKGSQQIGRGNIPDPNFGKQTPVKMIRDVEAPPSPKGAIKPNLPPSPFHGHGAMKTADREQEKYDGSDDEGKMNNDEHAEAPKAANYFGHGKPGKKSEKPSLGRGAAIGAGVGGATGLTLGALAHRGSEHATPVGKVVERIVKALPEVPRTALVGSAIGLGVQAIRRAAHDDKEKTAMEMRPFEKMAGRKDGNFFKDQAGAKSGMFLKEADAQAGYGPMSNPASAAMPSSSPGAMMGHGKPDGHHGAKAVGKGALGGAIIGAAAKGAGEVATSRPGEIMEWLRKVDTPALRKALGHTGKAVGAGAILGGGIAGAHHLVTHEKKAEPNTQVDGADRTGRDYTGPLAAPRNALFGVGEGVHGTNESSKFDKNTAAQMGHKKMALSKEDLAQVLQSAGTGAQHAKAKAQELGSTGLRKAKEIGSVGLQRGKELASKVGPAAQEGVDYLKEHPDAALAATAIGGGGAAYLGAKGLMRGGKALAGIPGKLLKRRVKAPPPGFFSRVGAGLRGALAHAR